ncbi:MAG: protein-export chaperone SecB [Cetobacterium sp.]|uniref:protein-export chaperone SecB n=1 Tax=Cetobacterium sp. TaxID=2071632 RepID=UPI003F3C0DFD
MLKFKNYKINKLLIENSGFDKVKKDNELGIFYKIVPNKTKNFDKVNIIQGIKISPSLKNEYTIEVMICGNFVIDRKDEDFTEDIILTNCGAILYPYLRSLISLLSSQVDRKILLPTLNFYKFIENISKDDLYGDASSYTDF